MTKAKSIPVDINRELGRLAEAYENAKEDRGEIRKAVEALTDIVGEMRGDWRALNQMLQSTTASIANITADRCGQRLDMIEVREKVSAEKFAHYDKILGDASSFMWRAAAWLCVAAVAGAGGLRALEFLAGH